MDSPRDFATTHWSLVVAAQPGQAGEARAREALEQLCRAYWYPLYAYTRRRGHDAEEAQDLTQSFFAQILEKGSFGAADREKGRFRAYLLGAMKHFLANEWQRDRAQKRGGDVQLVAWDEVDAESRFASAADPSVDAELALDREWALETVAGALKKLGQEMESQGKAHQFEVLQATLSGRDESPRSELAARLEMSEGAVKVAIHRLRRRYGDLLRAQVAETISDPADLDDELQHLVTVLREH